MPYNKSKKTNGNDDNKSVDTNKIKGILRIKYIECQLKRDKDNNGRKNDEKS